MAQYFYCHPENPQLRLLKQAALILEDGGVIAYPTDSTYALGCHIGDKAALDRIRKIRQIPEHHDLTLVCRDLSQVATYARLEHNSIFRLVRSVTPGPYTFILKATREVPRRLQHPKRKTVGVRIPDHTIVQELLELHGEPIMSTTLMLPGDEYPLTDPEVIRERLDHDIDLIIDGGIGGLEPTTIVNILDFVPKIMREGVGDPSPFELE